MQKRKSTDSYSAVKENNVPLELQAAVVLKLILQLS
jgi:hypothetical protein